MSIILLFLFYKFKKKREYPIKMEVDLVMNQTNYTREEAAAKLKELKNPIAVIRQYLAPPKVAAVAEKDASQLIHKTIRKFMEEAFDQKLGFSQNI